MIPILLLLLVACWCWFGSGPLFLRWPTAIIVLIFSSGHPIGSITEKEFDQFLGPLLTLGFVILGLWIILRGLSGGGRRQRRHCHRCGRYGRRWRDDYW